MALPLLSGGTRTTAPRLKVLADERRASGTLDILVLGSGEGGKYLAWHNGAIRTPHRRRGTTLDRRLLPEHQLSAQQERDLERKRSPRW